MTALRSPWAASLEGAAPSALQGGHAAQPPAHPPVCPQTSAIRTHAAPVVLKLPPHLLQSLHPEVVLPPRTAAAPGTSVYLLLSACQCYWQAQPSAELPLRCCGSVRAAVPVRACALTALGPSHHVQCHCRRHAEQKLRWQLPAGCHLDLYPMDHGWPACQRLAASYAAGLYWEAGVFAVAAVDVCLPALNGHLPSPLHPHHPGAAQQCSAAVSASCSSRCCQIAAPPHSALHLPSACALAAAGLRSHQPHHQTVESENIAHPAVFLLPARDRAAVVAAHAHLLLAGRLLQAAAKPARLALIVVLQPPACVAALLHVSQLVALGPRHVQHV